MSTPSHIRYKLRHVAEPCLFIKDMGPVDFSVNMGDPNLVLVFKKTAVCE